ncbi:MAG: restriction endonuclease [Candidatus Omnitrophota bacterium]|nr:MAG: restriction endonuclease [Candidatus Omnitrophota bacterium]
MPQEIEDSDNLFEGSKKCISFNQYERNAKARKKCIAHYGSICFICGFDFGEKYGSLVKGFIHVHHIVSLSYIDGKYKVDPIADLRPVCPNCHAVIHSHEPPFKIEKDDKR